MPEPQRDRGDRRAVDEVLFEVRIKRQSILSAKLRQTPHPSLAGSCHLPLEGKALKVDCLWLGRLALWGQGFVDTSYQDRRASGYLYFHPTGEGVNVSS